MDIAGEAVAIVRELHRLYFETRNYNELLSYFEKEARILAGADRYMDLNEAVQWEHTWMQNRLRKNRRIKEDSFQAEAISDTFCYAGGSFLLEEESGMEQTVLFSGLLKKEEDTLRIYRAQWSIPSKQLEKLLEERTAQLLERSGELKILSDNVPGGVVRLRYDKGMTILYASSGFHRMLGFSPEEVQGIFHNQFWNMIHTEDKTKVLQSWKAQLEYGDKVTAEFRMACRGDYMWILFNGQFITDLDGSHIFFGVLVDINKERQQQQALKEQAQLDPLTGVYNKLMAHYEVEDYLTSGQENLCGAFLMIDIDNFKDINDNFGHMFGDVVLEDIAAALKALFSEADIIGRFGGDEFIVFMKNIDSREEVLLKAGQCNEGLNRLTPGGNSQCRISCSIGIAFAPEHGKNFQELYGKADKALYRSKRKGKNRYSVYEDGIIIQDCAVQKTPETLQDGEEREGSTDSGLERMIFNLLYEASDIYAAIESVLKITGEYFDVSRAYIFEDSTDGLCSGRVFEWCGRGIGPQKDKLENVVHENGIKNYYLNFNEDGVFFCRDVHMLPKVLRDFFETQGIYSLLQCAIMDNGVFKGFIGFDECREQRCWEQGQIEMLSYLARVLSVFLLKKKQDKKL